ncbi:hypothetical protein SAMN06265795_11669 [Noviherbaspirillum humi]|uniref:Uncharacterized protein n=1 Tax=Noviherbaspirillum humi TaxID=1688639 RepID=A0A239KNW9_9BURK|nr:hypothetical protein [Noviherbaspirillum humi]SNT18874.1 hypothetical protein SAMN06265795_11669 [Noviherbaspirillum humi]
MTASSRAAPPASRPTAFASLRTALYAAVVLCHVAAGILGVHSLQPLLWVLSALAILVSLPAAGRSARALCLVFLVAGNWMLLRASVGWQAYLGAYAQMAYLLALFAVLPVLSVPVRLGGYSQAIQAALQRRVRRVFQLNCLVTLLAFICGSFMSLAAVPIMMTAMAPAVAAYPIRNRERFIAVSAISGYVLPILWTPVSGVVGVVLHNLRVDWLDVFPILFGLSLASLAANWLAFHLIEAKGGGDRATGFEAAPNGPSAPLGKLVQMGVAILLLVTAIVLVDRWTGIGLLAVVTVLALPFAFGWSALLGKPGEFIHETRREMAQRLPRMADQFAIFLGAGFVSAAMRLSGADHEANLMFLRLHDLVGTTPFLLLLPLMALAASFVGVHPLVAIALLGESLRPEALGIGASQLAVAMIGSAVVTYMLGPFSGTLGLVQAINRVPSFRLSLWMAPYAAVYLALLALAILAA